MQINELLSCYPGLRVYRETTDFVELVGEIEMFRQYDKVPLYETYVILLRIPVSFPRKLPRIYEKSNKIPYSFDHRNYGGDFCLGVTTEIFERLQVKPTLLFFFEEFVIPYLYSAKYYMQYHAYPFMDRGHGDKGILEFYTEKFNVSDKDIIIKMLSYVVTKKYRGHLICPCGSGKRVRNCHGRQLLSMFSSSISSCYLDDIEILRRAK